MRVRKREVKASDLAFWRALGEVVRERRHGISQDDFADRVGVYRSHMGLIERGELDLRLSTLLALANALDMPLSVLMNQAEERLPGEEGRSVDVAQEAPT